LGGRGAAEAFERALSEAVQRYGWCVPADVIMRNHFHLAVEIHEPNLSEGAKPQSIREKASPRPKK